jgi:hypothetical protein
VLKEGIEDMVDPEEILTMSPRMELVREVQFADMGLRTTHTSWIYTCRRMIELYSNWRGFILKRAVIYSS